MSINKWFWFIGTLFIFGAFTINSPHSASAHNIPPLLQTDARYIPGQQTEDWQPTTCMFDLPFFAVEGENIVCGYLIVPERHSQPTGPTIKLAVAILKSSSEDPAPDPLVMAQGGPGGSTIEFAQVLVNSPLLEQRDIVLFDQRGTLYSEPNLLCPEFLTLTEKTIEQYLSTEEALARDEAASLACHDRLVAEGVNLAAYNSLENAADVEALRVALGYDQINFYGVSYGTLLALHVMRDYPVGLRSVILDAVVPTQTNFIQEVPYTMNRAFTELFAACADDPQCAADYPDLEARFFTLVDQFNEEPAIIPLVDSESGAKYEAIFSGDILISLLFQFLYQTDFIPILPKMITDMETGNFTVVANIWPLLLFDRTFSLGMYQSVICAEDADFNVDDIPSNNIRPEIIKNIELENKSFLRTCEQWDVPDLGPAVDEPVTSDIPTLLFSGHFDPITPPLFGELVSQRLTNSYHFTLPRNGHGAALPGTPCINQVMSDFLSNPTIRPNESCIATQPQTPEFIPDNTLSVPLFGALAIAPGRVQLIQLSIVVIALTWLTSAWIVWPLGVLIHRMRQGTWPSLSWGERLSQWLVLFSGGTGLLFLIGLLVAIFFTLITASNFSILIVGLPRSMALLFLLPLLFLVMVILMVGATGLAWWRGYWSVLGRIYFTVLTISGIAYLVILIQWQMLGILIN